MNSGKRQTMERIELPKENIRTLGENVTYKYFGILEAKMKKYLRRTRKLLITKLYSRNLIKGINTWAVPLVRYSGPFLKWTRGEHQKMDQRRRKCITMHKALYPRYEVDRLYISRKEKGSELASIEDRLAGSIQQLEDDLKKCRGRLITVTRNNADNITINRTKITKKQKWEEMLGHFKRETSELSLEKIWTWLR